MGEPIGLFQNNGHKNARGGDVESVGQNGIWNILKNNNTESISLAK